MNNIFPKIHKEGYKFLAISIIATFIIWFFSNFFAFLAILITIWVYFFFRDPERFSIENNKYLVSPADGLITQVSECSGPVELNLENKKFTKVSIFMNVFNCHVNRSPLASIVKEIIYKPGKFLNASLDKASEDNERNYYLLKTKEGEEIVVVQIAGLIARRIITDVHKDQSLIQGERIGMIRFGSRVDVFFNKKNILAKIGQNVVAGESLIAED
tara:strand:+ start:364 stop:1008 length:645 start_codon:yes stop_codon:yes gene_type:complete